MAPYRNSEGRLSARGCRSNAYLDDNPYGGRLGEHACFSLDRFRERGRLTPGTSIGERASSTQTSSEETNRVERT
jgi:hypothetical protein